MKMLDPTATATAISMKEMQELRKRLKALHMPPDENGNYLVVVSKEWSKWVEKQLRRKGKR
jgi:hypothetical protein